MISLLFGSVNLLLFIAIVDKLYLRTLFFGQSDRLDIKVQGQAPVYIISELDKMSIINALNYLTVYAWIGLFGL